MEPTDDLEGDKDQKEEVKVKPDDGTLEEIGKEEPEPSLAKEEREKLVSYIEAALFLAGRPLGEGELAEFFKKDRITVRWALRRLKRELIEQNNALEVLHLTKDRWVLQLCEEFSRGLYEYIREFIPKEEMLSREVTDTLTEIAYRQPITSALLAKIVGNPNIYEHIKTLSERGFISLEKDKQTNILRTTQKFADIYGFDPEIRNLKIQLVWRLKKRAQLEKTG
ncbi:MAG TPA: SMC-Scp complex subunit ScpB [Candidatus Deferrimicrobium sp.]|nr:SMC-Scp complex subunit ScpB [Candidatus Deferrimicrobium sp.]